MKLLWTDKGWQDYRYWLDTDLKILRRVNDLIEDARRHPFHGIGKPEPLKNEMARWWSRRITQEHRLVYRVSGKDENQAIEVASCRFHYGR